MTSYEQVKNLMSDGRPRTRSDVMRLGLTPKGVTSILTSLVCDGYLVSDRKSSGTRIYERRKGDE